MTQPRILLVPTLTELEWRIKPVLEEWAEVASYDAPGVGDEPASDAPPLEAVAERGLEELDRRGWTSCFLASDEISNVSALRLARAHPEAIAGIALGHASLGFKTEGERPALSGAVAEAGMQLIRTDFAMFVRQDVLVWDPRRGAVEPPFDRDEMVARYLERVSPESALALYADFLGSDEMRNENRVEETLRSLDLPLLLFQHEGCPFFTTEGYEDVVAAFPQARTGTSPVGPEVSVEFAEALRAFCQETIASAT